MTPRPDMFTDSPSEPLHLSRPLAAGCRAIVTIPAKNEAATLPRCLAAFTTQTHLDGTPLPPSSFEILLLLNNCSDNSAAIVRQWHAKNPTLSLHIAERTLPRPHAHVGTARKLLMDAAYKRLQPTGSAHTAILSTDADTVVGSDWISQNLRALEVGADVVGGAIHLLPEDLEDLPPGLRHCYEQDRRYASLVAHLEDRMDPRPGDRWPRHLDHFGSSLACAPAAYALAGGMPAVSPLEDEAFVDCVRRASLTLRHEPAVKVFTSARLQGRARIGLAKQFSCWSKLPNHEAHIVPSAEFLEFRFGFMHKLRKIYASQDASGLFLPTPWWKDTFSKALAEKTCPAFLGAIYCDVLIAESFERERGKDRHEPIAQAIAHLHRKLTEKPPDSADRREATIPQETSAVPAQ